MGRTKIALGVASLNLLKMKSVGILILVLVVSCQCYYNFRSYGPYDYTIQNLYQKNHYGRNYNYGRPNLSTTKSPKIETLDLGKDKGTAVAPSPYYSKRYQLATSTSPSRAALFSYTRLLNSMPNHEAFGFTDIPTELCQHVTRFNCKETCGLCHLCNTPEAADRPECPTLCANGIKKCLKICSAGKSRCLRNKFPHSFKSK